MSAFIKTGYYYLQGAAMGQLMAFGSSTSLSSKPIEKPILRYFDEAYYLKEYPHVAESNLSAFEHYLIIGWKEHNDPGPEFSTLGYLNANSDVAAIEACPLLHFLQNGMAEGRSGWEKSDSTD